MTRVLAPGCNLGPLRFEVAILTEKSAGRKTLWKRPQLWKSNTVAFGDFSWSISTATWKSLRTKRSGFSTVTTASAITN
jgi:hypothetical protein